MSQINQIEIKPGVVLRAKGGELMQVCSYDPKSEFQFRMLNPETKSPTEFYLEGESHKLQLMFDEMEIKAIDLKTYEPTGLIQDAYKDLK